MPEYNFKEAHVFMVDSVVSQADYNSTSSLNASDLDYIGLMRQETGYNVNEEQQEKSSISDDLTLTWKLEINLEVLWKLDATAKGNIDDQVLGLVFADPDSVAVNADGSVITITGNPEATLLAPTRLYIKENEKFGSGQVTPMVITGRNTKATKAALRKTITLSQT